MNLCFCCENVDDLKKLDPFKWWNNVLQKVGHSVRVCQTLSLRERLGQNGDTEKQLFEKLGEWVRKPFQKPLPSQGEPWVELPNTQMVFYFLFQRTPISSKIWQRNVHLASRKSGAKKKSMGPKYSHTKWKGPSKQDHADGLVVVGAQQSQGGGVLSPAINHKARNYEAGRQPLHLQWGAKAWPALADGSVRGGLEGVFNSARRSQRTMENKDKSESLISLY